VIGARLTIHPIFLIYDVDRNTSNESIRQGSQEGGRVYDRFTVLWSFCGASHIVASLQVSCCTSLHNLIQMQSSFVQAPLGKG
jgi:hypothetical protein